MGLVVMHGEGLNRVGGEMGDLIPVDYQETGAPTYEDLCGTNPWY